MIHEIIDRLRRQYPNAYVNITCEFRNFVGDGKTEAFWRVYVESVCSETRSSLEAIRVFVDLLISKQLVEEPPATSVEKAEEQLSEATHKEV